MYYIIRMHTPYGVDKATVIATYKRVNVKLLLLLLLLFDSNRKRKNGFVIWFAKKINNNSNNKIYCIKNSQ